MQMWEWAQFRNRIAPRLFERIGVIDNTGKFHLTATYETFKYKLFGNVIYIPQGPIWDDEKALNLFTTKIRDIARQTNTFLIVCEPRVKTDSAKFEQLINTGMTFTKKAVQPRITVFLDLTQSEDELLASFSKTTRYNIRYAARKGVTIIKYTSAQDLSRIKKFYSLLQETRKRKYFYIQPFNYFEELWKEFAESNFISLYEARYKDELLTSLLVIDNNRWAGSLFSASSRKFSNLKATYLARWESIKHSKEKGCETYDFFGATDSNDKKHPFFNTTQFKLGFGRTIQEFAGTFEIILNPIKYKAWRLCESLDLFKFYEDSFVKEFRKRHANS